MAFGGQIPTLLGKLIKGIARRFHPLSEHLFDTVPGHGLRVKSFCQGEVDLPVGFAFGDFDHFPDDIQGPPDAIERIFFRK